LGVKDDASDVLLAIEHVIIIVRPFAAWTGLDSCD
jgi:hypothetical protein